jgi:predicted HNH restriction endonuclease
MPKHIIASFSYDISLAPVMDKVQGLAKNQGKSFSSYITNLIEKDSNSNLYLNVNEENDNSGTHDEQNQLQHQQQQQQQQQNDVNTLLEYLKVIESFVNHAKANGNTSLELARLEGQLYPLYESTKERGRELRKIERFGR